MFVEISEDGTVVDPRGQTVFSDQDGCEPKSLILSRFSSAGAGRDYLVLCNSTMFDEQTDALEMERFGVQIDGDTGEAISGG